jgi:glycosyltransferase involved in cell wall biosynthesis
VPWNANTRGRKIAESLANVQFRTTYIGPAYASRLGWRDKLGPRIEALTFVRPVRWLPPWQRRSGFASAVNVIAVYLPLMLLLSWRLLRTQADLVVVQNPILLPASVVHHFLYRSRLIFDGRERPAAISLGGSLATSVAKLEPQIYRACGPFVDVVLCVAEWHREEYRRLGFQKTVVLRNVPQLVPVNPAQPVRETRFRIGVIGSLMPGRGLEIAIDAAGTIRDVPVTLDLVGFIDPAYRQELELRKRGLCNAEQIHVRESVPPQDVIATARSYDVLLVLYEVNDPGNDSLPNKLFDAFAAGRPVIAGEQRAAVELVRQFGLGVAVESLGADSVAEGIRWLYRLGPEERYRMGRRAWALTRSEWNWKTEFHRALYDYLTDAFAPAAASSFRGKPTKRRDLS